METKKEASDITQEVTIEPEVAPKGVVNTISQEKGHDIKTVLASGEKMDGSKDKVVDLANLRSYRGSNDAVVRLAPTDEKLMSTIQDPEHHSRDEVLESISEGYSGEAYGDYQWDKTSGGWSTPKVPTIYGKFRSDYPQLSQLSLDIGVMTHLPELMELLGEMAEDDLRKLDHKQVREKLKEKLGYETMWRGMMLTEEEVEYVKKNGIMSPFAMNGKNSEQPKERFEARVLSTDVNELIERHFHGENLDTPFISVSAHQNVAIAVGRHFGNKRNERKLYLFKLKVPNIDRIHYAEHGIKTPYKLQNSAKILSIGINEVKSTYDFDKDAESYFFWKIDPQEIMEVTRPDVKESSWNGQVTKGEM